MTIPGNLLTTAMAVMPHTNVDQALKASLNLRCFIIGRLYKCRNIRRLYPFHKKVFRQGRRPGMGNCSHGIETFEKENLDLLSFKLKGIWKALEKKGIPIDQILDKSMLSPATCCLINQDKEKTVEKAFRLTNMLSQNLREYYKLI